MIDEFNPVIQSIHDYATKNESSSFDKVLPKQTVKINIESKRIVYRTRKNIVKIIAYSGENKFHEYIFIACSISCQSSWFDSLTEDSKISYLYIIMDFFSWVNKTNCNDVSKEKYSVLKNFEAYRMNDKGLRDSNLNILKKIIREGMACSSLSEECYNYLQHLTSKTKSARKQEVIPTTLNGWFDLPWLREVLGEKMYLQLESPRMLINSFRITVATTLLWLQEQRRRWMKAKTIHFNVETDRWYDDWGPIIINNIGSFDYKGEAEDDFNQLLLNDIVSDIAQTALKDRIATSWMRELPKSITFNKRRFKIWKTPLFFHPKYQTQYSPIEEQLCAWLIACEAIQPTDIPKLKTNNYAREYNKSGRLLAMECKYYKGRAGRFMIPDILMGTDPWTKALHFYINSLPEKSALFKTSVDTQYCFPDLNSKHTDIRFIYEIWKLPSFQKQLSTELERNKTEPIFLKSMLALKQGGEVFSKFNDRTGKTLAEYVNLIPRALPKTIFSLTHIKTSSVHARSDAYRSGDLVNHNSHTSLTEKTSYLTDANKEWLNQSGRITRLVIHDLQNIVYQPSITAISQAVMDRNLRTKVIQSTKSEDVEIYSLKENGFEEDENCEIIVSDTVDTALWFIHYLTQAKKYFSQLVVVRPDWVENTLIINIEWMSHTLPLMSSAGVADKEYSKLKDHLPDFFNYILETTE